MKRCNIFYIALFLLGSHAYSQLPKTYNLNSTPSNNLPLTNSVNDIVVQRDSAWFGTGLGLSLTVNGGISWKHFSNNNSFDQKGISALAVRNNNIWVATGYSTDLNGESVQTGGGLHYSTDNGSTWFYLAQPVDQGTVDTLLYGTHNRIRALAITVAQQNITFDIALTQNTIWTASWAGMLRKSTNLGATWNRVILPPDNLDAIDTTMSLDFAFDLSPSTGKLGLTENNNHKVFSIFASDDSLIWVGTAGGINKSTDGGMSWKKFSHQNQSAPISGNWVVALKEQRYNSKRILWAATRETAPDETQAISYSSDGGTSWQTTLQGERAWNIAVKDSIVYIATDHGIYRSSDYGSSWIQSGSIFDPSNLQRFMLQECYAVGVQNDTIWYGGSEGIAYTLDSPLLSFGSTWKIFRTYESVANKNRTYAYPNPFAPDDEPTRVHYSLDKTNLGSQNVTVRIFNFAMHPVRTLIQNLSRASGKEYDEIWDGKNDNHSYVSNGVYFYRVEISGQETLWGKIIVLK